MSGIDRYVAILRQFDEVRTTWTILDLAEAIDVPASSVYRIVRELVRHSFLARASEGRYRLGTAFVEFDRIFRLTDPLVRRGQEALDEFVSHLEIDAVSLLCSLYGENVMCVANAVSRAPRFESSYERGRPMPLTRGATSKVILAQLPRRRLSKLLERHVKADGTPNVRHLLEELSAVKKQGYCISRGEIDYGLVGIAIPIVVPSRQILASFSLVLAAKDLNDSIERQLTMMLIASSNLLTLKLLDEDRAPPSKQKKLQKNGKQKKNHIESAVR